MNIGLHSTPITEGIRGWDSYYILEIELSGKSCSNEGVKINRVKLGHSNMTGKELGSYPQLKALSSLFQISHHCYLLVESNWKSKVKGNFYGGLYWSSSLGAKLGAEEWVRNWGSTCRSCGLWGVCDWHFTKLQEMYVTEKKHWLLQWFSILSLNQNVKGLKI